MHDERAERAWEDASAALARGDTAGFRRHARDAALAVAAAGDSQAARTIAALREHMLQAPPPTRDPSATLAAILDAMARAGTDPSVSAADVSLLWPYALALVPALPDAHPLVAAAADLGWDPGTVDVVLAALASGEVTDTAMIALLTGGPPAEVAPILTALVDDGALVDRGDGLFAAAPILAAACAGLPSPHALAPLASRFPPEALVEHGFARDAIFIAEHVSPAIAVATLRSAAVAAIEVSRDARDDARQLGWLARDARWRELPLLVELGATPPPEMLAFLATVPRVIVTVPAPEDVATLGYAFAATGRDVFGWTPRALEPARAAAALAAAFAVPPEKVTVGHLHASDVDELARAIAATGEDALWALRDELARRAIAELSPFVFGAAPPLPPGVHDRARELLATDTGWGGRVSALVAPLTFAAPLALALAGDRGVVAATLALGAADAHARMARSFDAARRWGAVLCVGIDRASSAVMERFTQRLATSGVVAVIGVRPGTPVPPALAAITSTLMI